MPTHDYSFTFHNSLLVLWRDVNSHPAGSRSFGRIRISICKKGGPGFKLHLKSNFQYDEQRYYKVFMFLSIILTCTNKENKGVYWSTMVKFLYVGFRSGIFLKGQIRARFFRRSDPISFLEGRTRFRVKSTRLHTPVFEAAFHARALKRKRGATPPLPSIGSKFF